MTNKELIIQWEGVELRDETDEYCESFAVIAGCDEKLLLFDRDFFVGTEYNNSFQKGKIYKFSFSGELKKTSDNVIKRFEEGNFEVNEISEVVPFIRDIYKEKVKFLERKTSLEKELQEKNNAIQSINEERRNAKNELTELRQKFDELQFEKTKLENERITPEKHQELLDTQQGLERKLKVAEEENEKLSTQLEKINKQDWNTTLKEKIRSKREELEKLKDKARSKLDNNMLKTSLEVYLTANEQLTLFSTEKVSESICVPTKKQLERSEENLRKKVSPAELQKLRQVHSELVRMEIQQKQWNEWKTQARQLEARIVIPTAPIIIN